MTVLELLSKNKNNPRASDDAMLLWLYDRWKSEEGQKLRHQLEQREVERNTPKAVFLYDSSSFKYIFEEAANDCIEIANEEIFTHWFQEKDVTGRLLELLRVCDNTEEFLVQSFVKEFKCLQGAKHDNNISYRYKDSKNPRGSILWDCALCVAADMDSYDKYPKWYKNENSLISSFKLTVLRYIDNSGYMGVNLNNALDAYIAYSVYRALPRLQAYKVNLALEKERLKKLEAQQKEGVKVTVLTAPEFLQESIKKMYCKEDFEEWLDEMQDPDLRGWARECICEGLAALNIPRSTKGDRKYYRNIINKHSKNGGQIISFEEMQNKLLFLLFETWVSDGHQVFRDEISQRLPEEKRDSEGLRSKVEDYYSELCIYYEDDIHRLGGDTHTTYELWFKDEELYIKRLKSLLAERAETYSDEIENFVHAMVTVDDLLHEGKTRDGSYRNSVVPRKYLIWLSSVYEVAENECYGRENHQSFPNTASSMSSQELKWAGYEGKNFRNCLDVYCAFSAYNYMRNNIPKRKRIWPGRELHGKKQ